ncbi:MAG TPA: ferredoxin [Tepidiformaceae bacterium]|nr:ferredoxin [Tepidiformaceae bacterium]
MDREPSNPPDSRPQGSASSPRSRRTKAVLAIGIATLAVMAVVAGIQAARLLRGDAEPASPVAPELVYATRMKLGIDRDSCLRSGQCTYLHPDLFKEGDDHVPIVLVEHPEGDLRAKAEEAADICPASAILLTPDDED